MQYVVGRVSLRLLLLLLCFLTLTGCAQVPANFQTVLQNLAKSYPDLWRLATAVSYVLGFAMAMKALHHLKLAGEGRTMMSMQHSLKTPIILFVTSAALIFIPTTFADLNFTLFKTPNMLRYTDGPVAGFSTESIEAVLGAVQFIGLVAFIRGWLQVAKAGEHQSQPGAMGKGFIHIVGGLLAINIVQTKDVIWNTFGFG